MFAGVVLLAAGYLQIRVRQGVEGAAARVDADRAGTSSSDGPAGTGPEGPEPLSAQREPTALWVAWTRILGYVALVFGIAVLIVGLAA